MRWNAKSFLLYKLNCAESNRNVKFKFLQLFPKLSSTLWGSIRYIFAGMLRHFGTVKSEILLRTISRKRKIPFIIISTYSYAAK
jgi:hypothetical protein